MSAIPQENWLSSKEYLERERVASEKSDYWNGILYGMAGASLSHNRIVRNLIRLLDNQLLEGPCEVFPSDLRVWLEEENAFVYPDLTVVCGEQEYHDDKKDTLLNPTLVIEVLSGSTESYDRGKKFAAYRHLASVKEVLLVSQEKPSIEQFTRQGAFWQLSDTQGLESTFSLNSISCSLLLTEIYRKVEFPS